MIAICKEVENMASKYKAYTGKVLEIDLTHGRIGEYPLSDRDRELFVGGRYLSTKILWDELKPGIDPLSPENVLIIMTGPLTGTGAPSSSRYDISAKSPLTGAIGHSNSGGNFGLHLKKAGWDAIVIRGKAEKPVYIEIDNDNVAIKDAQALWGKNTHEAQSMLGKGGTVVIGPAGEHLVKYASAVSQERSHGRCGMGAVMGSKNLKGLVARGTKKLEVAEPEKLKQHYKNGSPCSRSIRPRAIWRRVMERRFSWRRSPRATPCRPRTSRKAPLKMPKSWADIGWRKSFWSRTSAA